MSEQDNRTNKVALTTLVNEQMDDWNRMLLYIQFAYNTSVNATTKCTPFQLMFGRPARLPLDLIIPEIYLDLQLTPEQYASQVKTTLGRAYELIEKNRDCRMDKNKISHDRRARAAKYSAGDQVLLLDEAIMKGTSNKLRKTWKGPYNVMEVGLQGSTVKIKPVKKNGRSSWVNISQLKTYFKKIPEADVKEQ